MRTLFITIISTLTLLYPLLIYIGINHFSIRYLALILGFIFIIRLLVFKATGFKRTQLLPLAIGIAGLLICIVGFVFNNLLMMKLYPVLINILLLLGFLYSLFYPPTIIERIARKMSKEPLPNRAIAYTKKVTIAWCGFFMINGLIALWTVFFSSFKIWAFYNGFLSYILIALFFSGEFLIRITLKARMEDRQ